MKALRVIVGLVLIGLGIGMCWDAAVGWTTRPPVLIRALFFWTKVGPVGTRIALGVAGAINVALGLAMIAGKLDGGPTAQEKIAN